MFFTCVCVFIGDLPNEAHVQTHGGGTPSESPVTTEDRVSQHPHPHLSHLNSTPSEFGQRSSGPAPMTNLWHQDSWHTVRSNQYTFLLRCNLHLKGSLCVLAGEDYKTRSRSSSVASFKCNFLSRSKERPRVVIPVPKPRGQHQRNTYCGMTQEVRFSCISKVRKLFNAT